MRYKATLEKQQLRDNSLYLLDFDQVRTSVADLTSFPASRELALSLEPSYDPEIVRVTKLETFEASQIIEHRSGNLISMDRDIRPIIEKGYKRSLLTGEEIHAISVFIDAAISTKGIGVNKTIKTPNIRQLSKSIPDLSKLNKEIKIKVAATGELLDGASPLLRELRVISRSSYQSATNLIQKIAGNVESSLQQSIVTVRDDRLVLPIKSELRTNVPGVVHSVSDSGATLFIEPMEVIELNNLWREQVAQEKEEAVRIYAKLSNSISNKASELSVALEVIAHIDLCLAKARYGNLVGANHILDSSSGLNLIDAHHPLISEGAVPISVNLDGGFRGLVISGPNTGGKTLALKTIGLALLMHQSGLMVPCSPLSELPIVDGVYADIGDHQSVTEGSSTFSSHITNITKILNCVTEESVVLLDEIGTGTDPDQGSVLSMALLDYLSEIKMIVIVTTHHQAVSVFAEQHNWFQNASVELHPSTLVPTFRLTVGVPGRSYAFDIAAHLGMEPAIIRKAESYQSPEKRKLDLLLENLQEQQYAARVALQKAEKSQRDSENIRSALEEKLTTISLNQNQIIEDTKSNLRKSVKDLESRLKHAESLAYWNSFNEPLPSEIEFAQGEIRAVQRILRSRIWGKQEHSKSAINFKIGDVVRIESLDLVGTISRIEKKTTEIEVRVGNYKIKVGRDLVAKTTEVTTEPNVINSFDLLATEISRNQQAVLDIRGSRIIQALEFLDNFLDQALVVDNKIIRVIHGKGSGALRAAIWKHLSTHKSVESYDYETRENGGDGVTLIELL